VKILSKKESLLYGQVRRSSLRGWKWSASLVVDWTNTAWHVSHIWWNWQRNICAWQLQVLHLSMCLVGPHLKSLVVQELVNEWLRTWTCKLSERKLIIKDNMVNGEMLMHYSVTLSKTSGW